MKYRKLRTVISAILAAVAASGVMPVNAAEIKESDNMLPYMNESLSFEERAADLVSRMTLEEKVSQLQNSAPAISRLGVGDYNYWREGLHGVARQGQATSFPSPLSMSNTWDEELIREAADITSTEARLKSPNSNLNYWSPTINMARDPRWGRNEETFGEDPYLTTRLASGFMEGMQGSDNKYLKTIATLKHFIANNAEGERTTGSSVMDEQTLRDYYGRAFEDIIKKARPGAVMSSYNATTVTRNGQTIQEKDYLPWDYLPSPANPYILTELLRRTWGFDGFVTGDCGAVGYLSRTAAYKKTLFPLAGNLGEVPQSEAVAKAFRAGNDMDCGNVAGAGALEAIQTGTLDEATVDIALYRLFLQRMKTGEFDRDVSYRHINDTIEAPAHIALAERAAEESWVLLKNEDDFLPLKNDIKNVVIVGSFAGQTFLGDYSGLPTDTTTPYEGLVEVLGDRINIEYIGAVGDDTPVLDIKALSLVRNDGTEENIDLSKAAIAVLDSKTGKTGVQPNGTALVDFTPAGLATVPDVDFTDVKSIKAEISADSLSPGGQLLIGYGSESQTVAAIDVPLTGSEDRYETVEVPCTANAGGYTGKTTMFLSVSAVSEFDMEKNKAKLDAADVIIAYAGTDLSDSSESKDRESIALPEDQSHIEQIAGLYGDKTIAVMQTVGQIDVSPFAGKVKAILWTSYNGQKQGLAFAKVISGEVNPSGRLTTTWYDPADLSALPLTAEEEISEGISWRRNTGYQIRQSKDYPGRTYQYYRGIPVYPFGYGLSYTDFEYSDIRLSSDRTDANGSIEVSVDVKNTGFRDGYETVQLYVKAPGCSGTELPLKQLKGFEKIYLKAGESKTVTLPLYIPDLHFYSEAKGKIYVPTGTYTIIAGKNSSDEENSATLRVTGEIRSRLEGVCVIPSGISVVSAVSADGKVTGELKSVDANLSAVMTDETKADLSEATVIYTSSDNDIACADDTGHVKGGIKSGTATITVSVTIDGVTKETSFPVVCTAKPAITPVLLKTYTDRLNAAYSGCRQTDYSEENLSIIKDIYDEAMTELEKEADSDMLPEITEDAIYHIAAVRKKPAPDTPIYTIDSLKNTVSGTIEAGISYNGDSMSPQAVLVADVKGGSPILTPVRDSGTYVVEGNFSQNDSIELFISKTSDKAGAMSTIVSHKFEISDDAKAILYNFSDPQFDLWRGSVDGLPLAHIDIFDGFGGFNDKTADFTLKYGGKDYKFTKSLQAGAGSPTKRCLYFTPEKGFESCKVTVIFNSGSEGRPMNIAQSGTVLATLDGPNPSETEAQTVSCTVTDLTQPIYIYGGSSNKDLLGIIVEYE